MNYYFLNLALPLVFYWPRLLNKPVQNKLVCLCVWLSYTVSFDRFFETLHLQLPGFCLFRQTLDFACCFREVYHVSKNSPKVFCVNTASAACKQTWCWFTLFNPTSCKWRKWLLPWGRSWKVIMIDSYFVEFYETIRKCKRTVCKTCFTQFMSDKPWAKSLFCLLPWGNIRKFMVTSHAGILTRTIDGLLL